MTNNKPNDVRVSRELLERILKDQCVSTAILDQQGEPICYQARHSASEPWFFTDKPGYWEWRALYAQSATARVVLPERPRVKTHNSHDWDEGYKDGYNACLDEVAKLNKITEE